MNINNADEWIFVSLTGGILVLWFIRIFFNEEPTFMELIWWLGIMVVNLIWSLFVIKIKWCNEEE